MNIIFIGEYTEEEKKQINKAIKTSTIKDDEFLITLNNVSFLIKKGKTKIKVLKISHVIS